MTPGKSRDLGDHTLMNTKTTGMNCHRDLTWVIRTQDIHVTLVQGALGGVARKDRAMIHLRIVVLRTKVSLIHLLTSLVQEVSRVIIKECTRIGILAGEDPQMSPRKEEALMSHMVRSVLILSVFFFSLFHLYSYE